MYVNQITRRTISILRVISRQVWDNITELHHLRHWVWRPYDDAQSYRAGGGDRTRMEVSLQRILSFLQMPKKPYNSGIFSSEMRKCARNCVSRNALRIVLLDRPKPPDFSSDFTLTREVLATEPNPYVRKWGK